MARAPRTQPGSRLRAKRFPPKMPHSGEVAERLKAPVLKTGRAQVLMGSNPILSVNLAACES